jgi:hypothetical protein
MGSSPIDFLSANPHVRGIRLEGMPVEMILPFALGIGLAAATGFRVFMPLLMAGLAAKTGYMPLVGDNFSWITSTPALLMLAVASIAEVIAYYIPGIDNLLDAVAAPAAVVAGIGVSAAAMAGLDPMVKWTLAIIAGGGAAGLTAGATSLARGHSTALTAGLGNGIISTSEIILAVITTALAVFAPILALVAVVIFLWFAYKLVRRIMRKHTSAEA